jgi:hypothetical protein
MPSVAASIEGETMSTGTSAGGAGAPGSDDEIVTAADLGVQFHHGPRWGQDIFRAHGTHASADDDSTRLLRVVEIGTRRRYTTRGWVRDWMDALAERGMVIPSSVDVD